MISFCVPLSHHTHPHPHTHTPAQSAQLIFVNTLHTGDFFGVGALRPGAGHVRAATIIATGGSSSTEEVRAMCLTRTGFDTFLSKFPGRRAGLMATIGQKMDHHLKTVPFLSGYGTSGS